MKKKILLTVLAAVMFSGCSLFDREPPVISGVQQNYSIRCSTKTVVDISEFMSEVYANDNVDGSVPVNASFDRAVDGSGQYTITYTATDKKGNTATKTAELDVDQPTEPILGKWESFDYEMEVDVSDSFLYFKIREGDPTLFTWERREGMEDLTGEAVYFAYNYALDSSLFGAVITLDYDNINNMFISFMLGDGDWSDYYTFTYKGAY